jgi:PAS domain S-box-containing protein
MEPKREELEEALASSPDPLLVCDRDGRILEVNDQVCRLIGYEKADLLSKTLGDLADPRDAEEAKLLLPALRQDGPAALETAVRCKDGTPLRLHLSLRPLRMGERTHSVIRVARRRRAADRLPEDPDFIRTVLGTSGMQVVSVSRDGKVCFASAAFQARTGLDFGAIRGKKIWELLQDPAETAALRSVIEQADAAKSLTLTLTWPTADGSRRTGLWTPALLGAPPGPQYVLLVSRDRTDGGPRPELEKRIGELTSQLEEIRGEQEAFTYTIAHDLRAPLRAMSGFSDALIQDYAWQTLDEKGLIYASKITQSARRMDELIEDLLVYSRLARSPVRLGPIPVGAIIPEVLHTYSREIEETNGLVDVDVPVAEVVADWGFLFLALCNLLSNALKFVPPGTPPNVTIRAMRRQEFIRIEFEDNGIGIPTEYLERIFGVFQRLNKAEAFAGAGMGLAIVRRAVERMSGRVGVESTPGKGSRFWIELLAAAE